MEAKKQGIGEEELSMEEILQSIRRIIADDDEGGAKSASPETANGIENPIPTSDILELTDMIADDGSITNLKEEAKTQATSANTSVDVLDNIDAALAPSPTPTAAPPPKIEIPVAAQAPAPTPVSAPVPPPVNNSPEISDGELDSLLSKAAENAALSSLSKLNIPEEKSYIHTESPTFRSGGTVEDMVEDLLRPMLKEWLDNNLPGIVEKIVEREVVRLTRR